MDLAILGMTLLLLSLISLAMVGFCAFIVLFGLLSRTWPSAQGVVATSSIHSGMNSHRIKAYWVTADYHYTVSRFRVPSDLARLAPLGWAQLVIHADALGAAYLKAFGLMPYYRVRVEGKDISVPMGDSVAVGFFTTRAVRARCPEEAANKVRSMIGASWTTGKYAAWNRGIAPTIHVEDVWRSPWFENLLFKNDGHTFYPAEGSEGEA